MYNDVETCIECGRAFEGVQAQGIFDLMSGDVLDKVKKLLDAVDVNKVIALMNAIEVKDGKVLIHTSIQLN